MVGFGDNIGSGFRKIMNAWKVLGCPTPNIHEEDEVYEVWLTLPLTKPKEANDGVNNNDGVNDGVNNNDSGNVGDMSEIKITERQQQIISLIKASPTISAKQMSEIMSVGLRTIERNTAKLKAMGILKRKGSDKNGEWILQLKNHD